MVYKTKSCEPMDIDYVWYKKQVKPLLYLQFRQVLLLKYHEYQHFYDPLIEYIC